MSTRRNALLNLVAAVTLASAPATRSATFDVNAPSDAADALAGDGACEATLGKHDCTLRAAIQEANALHGADTINVPAGVFAISIDGESEDEAATGDFDIRDSVTIRGAGHDQTILDGSSLDRVLDAPRSTQFVAVVVIVEGLTLRGGSHGGMRFLANGDLVLRDCLLTDNDAPAAGGGLYASGGSVALVRTIVSGNRATMQGGGIRIHAGELTLLDSEVSGNTAGGLRPAGIDASRSIVSAARSFVQDDLHVSPPEPMVTTYFRR